MSVVVQHDEGDWECGVDTPTPRLSDARVGVPVAAAPPPPPPPPPAAKGSGVPPFAEVTAALAEANLLDNPMWQTVGPARRSMASAPVGSLLLRTAPSLATAAAAEKAAAAAAAVAATAAAAAVAAAAAAAEPGGGAAGVGWSTEEEGGGGGSSGGGGATGAAGASASAGAAAAGGAPPTGPAPIFVAPGSPFSFAVQAKVPEKKRRLHRPELVKRLAQGAEEFERRKAAKALGKTINKEHASAWFLPAPLPGRAL